MSDGRRATEPRASVVTDRHTERFRLPTDQLDPHFEDSVLVRGVHILTGRRVNGLPAIGSSDKDCT